MYPILADNAPCLTMILKFKSFKTEQPLSKRLNDFRRIHYIELLIFVFNLAQGLRASANFPAFYSKVCHEIYSQTPGVCLNLKNDKISENIVQQETARWLQYNELVTFFPNLVISMLFGSFGDKYGRKIPTLVAIASMVLHTFFYMCFVSIPMIPVYVLVIEAGVMSLGGTKTVFVSAQYAEAASQTEDKSKLTQRFSILTACISCAIFVAGNLSPVLLKYCSLYQIMVVGQIVMTVAFFLAVLLHSPQVKVESNDSKKVISIPKPSIIKTFGTTIAHRKSCKVKMHNKSDHVEWFNRMLELYRSAWRTLTKSRPNRGRCHLYLICFVGLIYSCADSGMDTVTTLFVYHAPISWTPSIFSLWMATMSIVQLLSGLVGTHLLKHFKCSDCTVLLVGLTSTILKMVCTSIASTTWMMYLAVALGCISNVGISSLRSLVTQLGSSEEMGELTSMLSIIMGWSQLTGSIVCNNIYTVTIHLFAGLTFAIVAFLLTVCFFVVLFISFDAKKSSEKMKTFARVPSAIFYVEIGHI